MALGRMNAAHPAALGAPEVVELAGDAGRAVGGIDADEELAGGGVGEKLDFTRP